MSEEKTHVSPCSSQEDTSKEESSDSARKISDEEIVEEISEEASKPSGAKPLVERPPRKEDACERCRLSSVVLEVELFSKGRGSRCHADGPLYFLSCLIGNSTERIVSLVDTGCSRSAISLTVVERLGLSGQVDRSKRMRYEAMGGKKQYTSGMLYAPVRTASGFILIEKLVVVEMDTFTLMIGLDVLAVGNCSLILDVHRPMLMLRELDASCAFEGFSIKESADVVANLNGELYRSTLDTGSIRTVLPKSLDFEQENLSEPVCLNVAAVDPVVVCKKVSNLELEVNGCVGRVDPYVMSESHPIIGTDFLKNKRIDFIHGKAYVESLNCKKC